MNATERISHLAEILTSYAACLRMIADTIDWTAKRLNSEAAAVREGKRQ